VILLPRVAQPGGFAARLAAALATRGVPCEAAAPGPLPAGDLLVCPAPGEPACDLAHWLAAHPPSPATRLLVITRLGTHPDARSPGLRACWALEEAARAARLPVLTLRLAPLLGPRSPLWLRLRSRPRLPRAGRKLLNPVAEEDAVETVARAVAGSASWEGWYEVAGREPLSLAELCALAGEAGPPLPAGSGAWEPPLGEMEEHRLPEAGPWLAHFGLEARPLSARARAWGAGREGATT